MNSFLSYINELEEYTTTRLNHNDKNIRYKAQYRLVEKSKSIELNKYLRALVPIEDLRESGAFFTSDYMAEKTVRSLIDEVNKTSFIVDPACGTGNLLLACTKKLPIDIQSLRNTLSSWGKVLAGRDLHQNFVNASKLRIAIEALNRGAYSDIENIKEIYSLLKNISTGDGLKDSRFIEKASHIVVNPPFTLIDAPKSVKWSTGKINAAALFIQQIIEKSKLETKISAILPDVLRSGSRYKKWREMVSSHLKFDLEVLGKFDEKTNVDVFLLSGKRKDRVPLDSWYKLEINESRVGNHFKMSIGPVVDYRDPHDGPSSVFICSKDIKVGETISINQITSRRKFKGRLFKPPFVVIKRTSSPKEPTRSSASIIQGNELVAVENHVIIAYPKDELYSSCQDLLNVLGSQSSKDFLDERIRCRHLTISSIEEIPWRIK